MNKLKNEGGYALVTVLLIITLLMSLFLAFAGQSYNTVKQNQIVEKKSQAVALAEMGVSYFQSMLYNIYLEKRNTVNTNLSNYIKNNTGKTDEQYKTEAIRLMKVAIEEGLAEKHSAIITDATIPSDTFVIEMEDGTDASFEIKSTHVPSNNEVTFRFESNGYEGGKKSATLNGTMKLELTYNPSGKTIDVTSNTKELPNFTQFTKEETGIGSDCTNKRDMSDLGECDKILITVNPDGKNDNKTPSSISGNFNQEHDKGIYSLVPLYIGSSGGGSGNGIQNVEIVSNDSIVLGGSMNWINDVYIKSYGSTELNKNFRADSSNIYVKKQLVTSGQFELHADSFVYVDGTSVDGTAVNPAMRITGNNDKLIIDNSTFCIKGNLSADKVNLQIIGEGKLIVSGSVPSDFNIPGVTANVSNLDEFTSLCGKPSTTSITVPTIGWGDGISREVNY